MARKMKDSGIEWIGEIPEGWEIKRLGAILQERNEVNNPIQTTSILSLTNNRGVIPYSEKGNQGNKAKDDLTGYKIAHIGDIVLTSMNVIIGSVGLSNYYGAVSPVYYMLFPRNNIETNIQYYNYLFQTTAFQQSLRGYGNGILEIRMRIQMQKLKTVLLPVPTFLEQSNITVYLDASLSKLNILLSKTRSSIEEYKKLKQAVITQAVATQQCSHIKLKYLMNVIVDCPHETPTYSFTGNYYVIRTADQALASLRRDEDMYRLDASEYKKRTRRLTLDKDDIVYGREGERWGLACIVPKSSKYCLGQRIMQFRCNTKFLYPKYAMYALNSEPVYLQGVADTIGSTSPHVNISTICNYLLPVPALTEQKEIADYLDAKCAEIDGLIAKKEQLVKELESYKKSLIYEVVTGKREV